MPGTRIQEQLPELTAAFFGMNQFHLSRYANRLFGNFNGILEVSHEINKPQLLGAGT